MVFDPERQRIQLGLPTAIRAAALDAGIHVTVLPGGTGRYAPEIESAVYRRCADALNAAKQSGAASVAIALEPGEDGALRFEINDDGAGDIVSGTVGPEALITAPRGPSPSRA